MTGSTTTTITTVLRPFFRDHPGELLLCIVDTFDVVDFTALLCSLRCIVFTVWLNYLTLCKGLGSWSWGAKSCLGLDQKGLVLVLGNFWSLGLGLEEKVANRSLWKFRNSIPCTMPQFRWRPLLKWRAVTLPNANIGERKTTLKWILHVAKFRYGARSPMYIVYQSRRRPNIMQTSAGFHWATSLQ